MSDGGHGYTFTRNGVTYRVHTVCGDGQITRIVVETMPAQENKQ